MENTEKVTGPGRGIFPLLAVIVLTVATWGGLWELHKMWYNPPLNPLGSVEAPAAH